MAEQTHLELRNNEPRPLPDEALRLYEQGESFLHMGRLIDAREAFAAAFDLAPEHARIRSMWGLALAVSDRDFERARAHCESAAKQEFFNPDLYLNLARVYLSFGRRAEALRYLRRGQMIDPGHQAIRLELANLGQRNLPILPFLPRRHPLNRALGRLGT